MKSATAGRSIPDIATEAVRRAWREDQEDLSASDRGRFSHGAAGIQQQGEQDETKK
ncbi:hypothetical protein [Trichloromonas sp.]|uniref:hypothetical protein n=1 Tax=Trichloromonas sp. TaxID=3069249 RepID=UPI002A44C82D|nr:hypothetical protein [Trichloromonas sp.]